MIRLNLTLSISSCVSSQNAYNPYRQFDYGTYMNIVNARKKLGYSQQVVADMVDFSKDHISKMERKKVSTPKTYELSLECLLRRSGLYGEEQHQLPGLDDRAN